MPVFRDSVADEMTREGRVKIDNTWKAITADKDGWVPVQAGYFYATYNAPREEDVILNAVGDTMVYVNGEPRPGDPYESGYLKIPVHLQAGENTFLFSVGRGHVKASLEDVRSPQQIETADATLPDEVVGESARLFGAVVVLNSADKPARGLTILANSDGRSASTTVPEIPPHSLRKVRFDFWPGSTNGKIALTLKAGRRSLDVGSVEARLRKPTEQYKRTFVSDIDGSVQYYAVCPALRPSESNSLVLTLHGASVEAIGQAQAYAPKDWCWIVAPTNRRPYGFDWEDWGRIDAMEVLAIAKQTLVHNPYRVYLTGHSMGGHGTWSVGTMFPDQFGVIAPSAGWISFWSYAGGWDPKDGTDAEKTLRASMSGSDTLLRARNLADLGVYILHGDADDNVPVEQARTMRQTLAPIVKDLHYYERPGAGHWWGNECVDWPGIFEMFATRERQHDPAHVQFITPDPALSATDYWATIEEQEHSGEPSSFDLQVTDERISGTTTNIAAIRIDHPCRAVEIDRQRLVGPFTSVSLVRTNSGWRVGQPSLGDKTALAGGPFKLAYQNRFVLVYGTQGSREENAWSYARARYDAETWYYRGNGAVDMMSDVEAASSNLKGRGIVVYGNSDTNSIWKSLLADCPIQVSHRGIMLGKSAPGSGPLAALFCYPSGDQTMVAAVGGTDLQGMRLTDRLPIFSSGVAYPDYTIVGPDAYRLGPKGIIQAGYFDRHWHLP